MPLPIQLAHRLAERLAEVRRDGTMPCLRPDGKTQVTVIYEGDRPVAIKRLLMSSQHVPEIDLEAGLAPDLWKQVVTEVVPSELLDGVDPDHDFLVNPTGRFEIGGPNGDTGLTGRKIIVDTYGGYARHGGGAFSGKDPTKVDRSAAYAARHAAKNVVAAGLAKRCELQVVYAIGVAQPMSVHLETFGTEKVDPHRLGNAVREVFDFRPSAILERFGLRRPIYTPTSAYGHFGRPGFPWRTPGQLPNWPWPPLADDSRSGRPRSAHLCGGRRLRLLRARSARGHHRGRVSRPSAAGGTGGPWIRHRPAKRDGRGVA